MLQQFNPPSYLVGRPAMPFWPSATLSRQNPQPSQFHIACQIPQLMENIGSVQPPGVVVDGARIGGGGLSLATTGEQNPTHQRQLNWGRGSSNWAAAAPPPPPQLFVTPAASSGFPSQIMKQPSWLQKNRLHSLMRPN